MRIRIHRSLSTLASTAMLLSACEAPVDSFGLDLAEPSLAITRSAEVVKLDVTQGTPSVAKDINERGEITGVYVPGGSDLIAFYWYDGVTTPLGTLGGRRSNAGAINIRGEIAGTSETSTLGISHAFLWKDGVMTDLGSFGGWSSMADLNDNGVVVGTASYRGGAVPFVWQNGVMTRMPTLGGNALFSPFAELLNERGQFVGGSMTTNGEMHATLWTTDGRIEDLGTLGGTWAVATAINDLGEVVGYSTTVPGDFTYTAFRWRSGVMEAIPGVPTGAAPRAINNRGQIVGVSTGSSLPGAWIVEPNGTVTHLGRTGGRMTQNDRGQVAFTQWLGLAGFRQAVWEAGQITLLPTLGGRTGEAWNLSMRGQIVGSASPNSGSSADRIAVRWDLGNANN